MTYEHAIKQLEDDALFEGVPEEINPLYAAYTVAITAMEKQIPKPLKELKNPNPIELGNDYAECPNCGEWLGKKKLAKHRYNYCPKCGQRIDWEREVCEE